MVIDIEEIAGILSPRLKSSKPAIIGLNKSPDSWLFYELVKRKYPVSQRKPIHWCYIDDILSKEGGEE